MSDDNKGSEQNNTPMGAGIAIGAGLGAVLFAITDNPVWIGLGAGIGVALGAGWNARNH